MPSSRSAGLINTHGNESPLIRTLPAKRISAVQLFQKMNSGGNALLLDGAMGGWFEGRFSLLSNSAFGIFRSKGRQSRFDYFTAKGTQRFSSNVDPIASLQGWLDRFKISTFSSGDENSANIPFLHGGLAGFFSYELVHQFENIPLAAQQNKHMDDIHLLFLNFFILIDHRKDLLHIVYTPSPELRMGRDFTVVRQEGWQKIKAFEERLLQSPSHSDGPDDFPSPIEQPDVSFEATSHCSRNRYIEMVSQAKEYIVAGEIFQANLSHCFTARSPSQSLFPLYQKLSAINPSPFSAYLNFGGIQIASVSPERLVRIKKGLREDVVETRPIAGTKPRGTDKISDQHLVNALYQSDKERAEHLMLIDLARNDLGKICRYGTVKVDSMMTLEQYSHVSHLVSNITGVLVPDTSPLEVLKALFPGGTITGVPKIRCMSIISELEKRARGIYTGAIGYLGFDGEMDLNIAIRTAVLENKCLSYQVGAGIVADSEPELEYQETLHKAAAFFKAIEAEKN